MRLFVNLLANLTRLVWKNPLEKSKVGRDADRPESPESPIVRVLKIV